MRGKGRVPRPLAYVDESFSGWLFRVRLRLADPLRARKIESALGGAGVIGAVRDGVLGVTTLCRAYARPLVSIHI